MVKYAPAFLLTGVVALMTGCSFRCARDIVYDSKTGMKLDVYTPKKISGTLPSLVFFHGGNWKNGKRSQYYFLGRAMAKHGIALAVVDYRLSPAADYSGMGEDAASAVAWASRHMHEFGGDTTRLYAAGHSSGGHLAALVSNNRQYLKRMGGFNPIRGTILIDAFGLDMFGYMSEFYQLKDTIYLPIFSREPETWKEGSPIYHIHPGIPPCMLMIGGKSMPVITKDARAYIIAMQECGQQVKLVTLKERKHIGMVTQLFNSRSKAYKEIEDFIRQSQRPVWTFEKAEPDIPAKPAEGSDEGAPAGAR